MGLSASQARLLSITQRLSNNELESEFIANAKMQLATRNTLATEKYINALDSTKMEYISYDDTGIQETVALTFNSLNGYTALKNQYGVYNPQGQIYVSREDAADFAAANSLKNFLGLKGLYAKGEAEYTAENAQYEQDKKRFDAEMDAYNTAKDNFDNKIGPEWVAYNAAKTAWLDQKEAEYYNAMAVYYASSEYLAYDKDHDNWEQACGSTNPYEEFKAVVGTSDAPSSCYGNVINSSTIGCFTHVLAHLIDMDATGHDYKTSTGNTVHVSVSDASGSALGTNINTLKSAREAIAQKYTSTSEYIIHCDGDDDRDADGMQNSLKGLGENPSEVKQLMSDYYILKDADGAVIKDAEGNPTYGIKSVFQKAVDMMYLLKNLSSFTDAPSSADLVKLLINFTDGDMSNMNFPEPQAPTPPVQETEYPGPEPVFKLAPPTPPEVPENILKIYDKPLAQWYINLWYAMEGMSEAQQLDTVCDENANFSHYSIVDVPRSSSFVDGHQVNNYYTIIDDELASDSQWLEFAINNGLVTLRQIALRTNGDLTWEGTEFSSTSDMYEIEDTSAIAKAEAEYQKTLYQIQSEDKELDAEIKKLDTEHSALQTEVESIKNVMTKNVEKSFSVFS